MKRQEVHDIFIKRDEACFQCEMAHGDFKDLFRTTDSEKVLRDKTLNIAKRNKMWWISKRSSFNGL